MVAHRWGLGSLALVVALVSWGTVSGQDPSMPFEPQHRSGASVTGAYDGWFPNKDGTFSLLVGYYNRNLQKSVDIPIGPDNNIEPGGPDQGQPTHFDPSRQWGLFVVKAPKDFGNKSFIWTLTIDGITTKIPLDIREVYQVAPYIDANGNTPPYVGFSENGPFKSGPPLDNTESLTAKVGVPLPLTVWAADSGHPNALPGTPVPTRGPPKKPVTLLWGMYRGPGTVKFNDNEPVVEKIDSQLPGTDQDKLDFKATNTATFSEVGQYVLFVQASNSTGSGGAHGFQCCWTTAKVNVTVVPATENPE